VRGDPFADGSEGSNYLLKMREDPLADGSEGERGPSWRWHWWDNRSEVSNYLSSCLFRDKRNQGSIKPGKLQGPLMESQKFLDFN